MVRTTSSKQAGGEDFWPQMLATDRAGLAYPTVRDLTEMLNVGKASLSLVYAMPRAIDAPPICFASQPVPTGKNPLGARSQGRGRDGTVAAMPCVMNAAVHALAPLGVRTLPMPATAQKVWRAIRDARNKR